MVGMDWASDQEPSAILSALINYEKRAGYRVVIESSMFRELIDPLLSWVEIEHVTSGVHYGKFPRT